MGSTKIMIGTATIGGVPPLATLNELNRSLQTATPQAIIAWAVGQYPGRVALSVSFGGDGGTMLAHMVSPIRPGIPILFLDTGLLFAETYEFRAQLARTLDLSVINVTPPSSVDEQATVLGPNLWERDPDQCCHLRKALPMQDALQSYDAWITGIRRGQTATRSEASIVSFAPEYNVVKICPLLNVSEAEITDYLARHSLPRNPLLMQGYSSIGCWPCTTRTLPREDSRAGRWRQHVKMECGLHQPVHSSDPNGKDPS